MENQQSSHTDCDQNRDYQQSYYSPLVPFKGDRRVLEVLRQHPNTFAYDVEIIKRVDAKQSEKGLIIESPNTVIKKPAVMIEFLSAPITSIAVIAVIQDRGVTDMTKSYLILPETSCQFTVSDQTVHGIESCQHYVVVADYQQQTVVKTEQDPQNLGLYVVQSWNDED